MISGSMRNAMTIQSPDGLHELLGLEFFGLQYRQPQLARRDLHVAFVHLAAAPRGFVGSRDHGHHIVPVARETTQRRHGELGGSHEYYAQILSCHNHLIFFANKRFGRYRFKRSSTGAERSFKTFNLPEYQSTSSNCESLVALTSR